MPMRIKIKEPEPYDDTRNTKLLDNFCWDSEQYLDLNASSNEAKVNIAAMFLRGTAKLWWRNRVEDLVAGKIVEKIENLAKMKATLKAQFGPKKQAWIARNQLLALKHASKIESLHQGVHRAHVGDQRHARRRKTFPLHEWFGAMDAE